MIQSPRLRPTSAAACTLPGAAAAAASKQPLPSKLFGSKKELGLANVSLISRPGVVAAAALAAAAAANADATGSGPFAMSPPPSKSVTFKPQSPPAQFASSSSFTDSPRSLQQPQVGDPPVNGSGALWRRHKASVPPPGIVGGGAASDSLRSVAAEDSAATSLNHSAPLLRAVGSLAGNRRSPPYTAAAATMVDAATQHEVAALVEILCTVATQTEREDHGPRSQPLSTYPSFVGHRETPTTPTPGLVSATSGGGGLWEAPNDTLIGEIMRQKKSFEQEKDALVTQLDAAAAESTKMFLRLEDFQKDRETERAKHIEHIFTLSADLGKRTEELHRADMRIAKLEKTVEGLEQDARRAQTRTVDSTITAMESHLKKKLEEATKQHREAMDAELIETRKKKRELQNALDDLEASTPRVASASRRRSSVSKSASRRQSNTSGGGGSVDRQESSMRLGQSIAGNDSGNSPNGGDGSPIVGLASIRRVSVMDVKPPAGADKARADGEAAALQSWRRAAPKPPSPPPQPFGPRDEPTATAKAGDGSGVFVSSTDGSAPPPDSDAQVFDLVGRRTSHAAGGGGFASTAATTTRSLATRRASAARRSSSVTAYTINMNLRRNEQDNDAAVMRMEQTADQLARVVKTFEATKGVEAMRSVEAQVQAAHTAIHAHYAAQVEALQQTAVAREQTLKAKWDLEVQQLKHQLHAKLELIRQQHVTLDATERRVDCERRAKDVTAAENTALVGALAELHVALEVDACGDHRTLCSMCHKDLYRTAVALTHKYTAHKQPPQTATTEKPRREGGGGNGGHDGGAAAGAADPACAEGAETRGLEGPVDRAGGGDSGVERCLWIRDVNGGLRFGGPHSTRPGSSTAAAVSPATVAIKPFSPGYRQERCHAPFSPDTARLKIVAVVDPSLEGHHQ